MENKRIFDNDYYYALYPDVKDAVVNKKWFKNGEQHYILHGEKEGRQAKYFGDKVEDSIENTNKGWTDHLTYTSALTLGDYKEPERGKLPLNIEHVPNKFKPVQEPEYPRGNKIPFERYFEQKFNELMPRTYRTYLPVYWTAYYVNNKYAADREAIVVLQRFIDKLDKTKKYFTIIQYDDGILNNVKDIDLLVYSMGCGKKGYYPIPLISQPLNNTPSEIPQKKDILYSFQGADTHKLRRNLCELLKSDFVKFGMVPPDAYYETLKRSVFAICPRGYGVTSFRMYEAMHFGCIPVYISDKFWEPFNLPFEYGIKIRKDQIKDIPAILSRVNVADMQRKVKYYYENFFVYSSCYDSIIQTLSV